MPQIGLYMKSSYLPPLMEPGDKTYDWFFLVFRSEQQYFHWCFGTDGFMSLRSQTNIYLSKAIHSGPYLYKVYFPEEEKEVI